MILPANAQLPAKFSQLPDLQQINKTHIALMDSAAVNVSCPYASREKSTQFLNLIVDCCFSPNRDMRNLAQCHLKLIGRSMPNVTERAIAEGLRRHCPKLGEELDDVRQMFRKIDTSRFSPLDWVHAVFRSSSFQSEDLGRNGHDLLQYIKPEPSKIWIDSNRP